MEEMNVRQEQDYGVVLFEKSNAKHVLDAPSGKVGAKGMAQRVYMLILGAALFGWFLYSLIYALTNPEIGVAKAIVNHIAPFFVLFVAEFILILTAFNAWGKFARGALKHKALTRQRRIEGARTRQLEAEFNEADANKAKEYAIRVYRDCILVINEGETTVIRREELQRVRCEPNPMADLHGYLVTFELYDKEPVVALMTLGIADLPSFRKHFDNFEYTPAHRGKEYLKKRLPTAAFMLVPLLIGAAIIIVRSLVLPDIPLIIGLAFLSFGTLLILAQFSDVAVIGNGIMPIFGGVVLAGIPIGIALTLVDLIEEITLTVLFTQFTALHAGLSVFLGFGPLLIIVGIAGLVDCARL